MTCFITRSIESDDPESYARFPEQAVDPRRLEDFFLRFGLPARIAKDHDDTRWVKS